MNRFTKKNQSDMTSEVPETRARLVKKDGQLNIEHQQLTWGNPLYTDNAVHLKWIPLCQSVILVFFGFWIIFASFYYMAEVVNNNHCSYGGEQPEFCDWSRTWKSNGTVDMNQKTFEEEKDSKHKCVEGVVDFTSALLFSVETMTTIGYGSRALTEECPVVIFIVFAQSMLGIVITGILTGLIMSKFEQPANKSLIKFSSSAVVTRWEGRLYLVVKVAEQTSSRLEGVTASALLSYPRTSPEGEHDPHSLTAIAFGIGSDRLDIPYLWPVCLIHPIDEASPFWQWEPDYLTTGDWEILLWVNGTTSSGIPVTARTSYRAGELLWGAAFSHSGDFERHHNTGIIAGSGRGFPSYIQSPPVPWESAAAQDSSREED